MKTVNNPNFNSWQHPFWKFGCLLPIVLFVGAAFICALYDVITGKMDDKDREVMENKMKIDSLSHESSNLAFEGISLGKKFNKNGLANYNLSIYDNDSKRDSSSYVLRHNDYYSGHYLNSNQEIYVYTTHENLVYQIVIKMKNDDVYTDAFFEKYDIKNASKKELPNNIIWAWTWSNQMLELSIPKGSLDLEIKYLDFDILKIWQQFKIDEHDAEINALMRDKEECKANI